MRAFQRPRVRLAGFRVCGISHELLTDPKHLNRMQRDLGERFFGAIEIKRLGRLAHADQISASQLLLEHFPDSHGDGLIQNVDVDSDNFTRQDTDAAARPLRPQINMHLLGVHLRPTR